MLRKIGVTEHYNKESSHRICDNGAFPLGLSSSHFFRASRGGKKKEPGNEFKGIYAHFFLLKAGFYVIAVVAII